MTEKFTPNLEKAHNPFHKGALVTFRDDLPEELKNALAENHDLTATYRVFYFSASDDEGGDAVELGPADASPQEIEDFDPTAYIADVVSGLSTKRDINPVATRHLKVLTN